MSTQCSRRDFLTGLGLGAAAFLVPASGRSGIPSGEEGRFWKKARHWEPLPEHRVRCLLCPRKCEVADRERGTCGVRENRDGTYYTLVHSRPCSLHIDPVEKKPFFHVLPGTRALSIATAGCNIECRFCQNWEISQFRPEQVPAPYVPPEEIARRASESGCATIAYTYSEPVIFYEYMVDCAAAANPLGVRSLMVSNGFIREKPMREACEVLAAVKIDLKAFTEEFYRKTCSGELKPVLQTLQLLHRIGIWHEIVVLLVPGLNDGREEIDEMTRWIAGELGPEVPVHFSRFHPTYKMKNLPPTPVSTLERAWDTARKNGLLFVYVGNVPGHPAEQTVCPDCGAPLIRRYGYHVIENRLKDGACPDCGRTIPGIWK